MNSELVEYSVNVAEVQSFGGADSTVSVLLVEKTQCRYTDRLL